jgi:hypothetical protein
MAKNVTIERTALNDFYASTTTKRPGSAPKFVNRRGPAITGLHHRPGRLALIASLEDLFGRVQVFGDPLTLANTVKKSARSERGQQVLRWFAIAGSTKGAP